MTSKFDQNKVSVDALQTLIMNKPDTVVIDLLSPEHFAGRHIPGAENVCVFQVSFLDDLAGVVADKHRPIVVYGSSSRSRDAAVALEKLDRARYQQVSFLDGGLEAWREAGYELKGEAADRQDDLQTTVIVPDGQYRIDHQLSEVEWVGRNANSRHFGTVDIAGGELYIEERMIFGMIEIDMTTIHNKNLQGNELQPVLENHLRSDDFFFTDLFPRAVFTIKKAACIEPGWLTACNYHVNGELELRGVAADLEFDATVVLMADNSLVLDAHFDIDRTKWQVIYGSTRFFEHLGMHKVFDLISLQLRLVAARQ
ncbi:YceI family protein [Desulfocastanea catecholica]